MIGNVKRLGGFVAVLFCGLELLSLPVVAVFHTEITEFLAPARRPANLHSKYPVIFLAVGFLRRALLLIHVLRRAGARHGSPTDARWTTFVYPQGLARRDKTVVSASVGATFDSKISLVKRDRGNAGGHLFGASGRHARVVVMTVTGKEFPVARQVFGACGSLVEVDHSTAWVSSAHIQDVQLPFVLVQATDRGNTPIGTDVEHWVREFRPQVFLLVGTAGGISRPVSKDLKRWDGPARGDVLISEFVHHADFRKSTSEGPLMRYHRLDQPTDFLLRQARAVVASGDGWHSYLGPTWADAKTRPRVSEVEFLGAEQIQDDPLDATQQRLMKHFDRAGAAEMESVGLALALHGIRQTATYAPMYLSVRGVSDIVYARSHDGEPLTAADLPSGAGTRNLEGAVVPQDKTSERDLWSPRAAASASAFALALVARLAAAGTAALSGHPQFLPSELLDVSGRG